MGNCYLSIIIPCYNEEHTIRELLELIFRQNFSFSYELVLIDDGSKVPLSTVIGDFLSRPSLPDSCNGVSYYRFRKNMGKGTAIVFGIQKARGEFVLIQDADLEYHPVDIPLLLDAAEKSPGSAVYGSRFMGKMKDMSRLHIFGNSLLTRLTNFLYHSHLTDMETGYKLIPRKVLSRIHLESREFELEPELTAKLLLEGIPILEVPIRYIHRTKGNAKINILDGLEAAFVLFRYRYFIHSRLFSSLYYFFKYHIKKLFEGILRRISL